MMLLASFHFILLFMPLPGLAAGIGSRKPPTSNSKTPFLAIDGSPPNNEFSFGENLESPLAVDSVTFSGSFLYGPDDTGDTDDSNQRQLKSTKALKAGNGKKPPVPKQKTLKRVKSSKKGGVQTATPSVSQSASPTATPAFAPSESPSTSPGTSPTVSPSNAPSPEPSDSPSDSPTTSPSNFPSEFPTTSPSKSPSDTAPSSSSAPNDDPHCVTLCSSEERVAVTQETFDADPKEKNNLCNPWCTLLFSSRSFTIVFFILHVSPIDIRPISIWLIAASLFTL